MHSGTFLKNLYRVAGAITLGNGLWMLLGPTSWYNYLPADVPDTGPLNIHFIHDVGVAFFVVGLGFFWCASNLERCRPVHMGLTAFFTGHAIVHVGEILAGELPTAHWWVDIPLVFGPAILMIVISLPSVWQKLVRG